MLLSERGKTSPSFLIAVLVVVLGVVGVFGWRYFKPNPFKQSENIVRESRVVLSDSVRDFEQEVRDLAQKPGADPATTLAAIEKQAETAKAEIDSYVDEARGRLSELDIPLKTHQNRADRLGEKADEAKSIIDDRVEEKREQLSGS
jgi:predicted negative regulator of RcsB-dependent stress response